MMSGFQVRSGKTLCFVTNVFNFELDRPNDLRIVALLCLLHFLLWEHCNELWAAFGYCSCNPVVGYCLLGDVGPVVEILTL